MKTIICVDYDVDTGGAVVRFTNSFSALPKEQQLEIAQQTLERMQSLVASLQAIIARSSAGNP